MLNNLFNHAGILKLICVIFLLFISCKKSDDNTCRNHDRKIHVCKNGSHYTLIKEGHPFEVKGAAGVTHYWLLKELGANTVRVYDTTHIKAILDSAAKNKLSVIVGLPQHRTGLWEYFYKNPSRIDQQFQAYKKLVLKYKDHPALLSWCIGNELDFPSKPAYQKFYEVFNNLLQMIHTNDPDHPVTTSIVNLNRESIINIQLKINNLDYLSLNIFGAITHFPEDIKKIDLIWNGPYLISEWGINGHWEVAETSWKAPIEISSSAKVAVLEKRWNNDLPLNDSRNLGTIFFYWGHKQERTHTWFNIFDENGKTTEVVRALYYIWKAKKTGNNSFVERMLINNLKAENNVLLETGENCESKILLKTGSSPVNRIEWQLLPEDWYDVDRKNARKPYPLKVYSTEDILLHFKAPEREGPFRLFARIYFEDGTISTANLPFYIFSRD